MSVPGRRERAWAIVVSVVAIDAACLGQPTMKPDNLARLHETTPGAARALAWLKDGTELPVPALTDGDISTPAKLPDGCQAIGVEWPIRHVVNAVRMWAGKEAAPGTKDLRLEAFDGLRWIRIDVMPRPEPDTHSLRWDFRPVATHRMRVRWAAGPPAVAELEVRRYEPPTKGGRTTWPAEMVTRRLEQRMLAEDEEPSFERLALHGLSMPVWAMMGIKDWPHEQAVSWDGRVLVPLFQIVCGVGTPPKTFADVRDTVRRRLIDGWRPGVITEGRFGAVEVSQTCFVTFVDAEQAKPGLYIRYELRNVTDRPVRTALHVRLEWDDRKSQAGFAGAALRRGRAAYLVCVDAPAAGGDVNAVTCPVELAAGAAKSLTFAAPVNYRGGADRPISEHLAETSWDRALEAFRGYWDRLLAPAARLELPEQRLNHLYKAVVAQLFINADRDVMPYGARPSAYEGRLYGVEEGYAMMALAYSGLHGDAQRYLDGTYLTKGFLRKVEAYRGYGDRHQQYRNGLVPMYAVAAYRVSRDRKWIEKHVPLLKECAEWTITNRRKTMTDTGGERPAHWGLLPKWSYGGDLAAQQCYPLYANYACCRGLKDTAWLMRDLGDAPAAERYAKEAEDYRKAIESVVDRIYRTDADPPFLPPHVYAKTPEGEEYYQLFAGCALHLQPFLFADRRCGYLSDFLEADNRTFCLLPRFRRDVGPGGLDAIYGLGYILDKLHRGRLKEFLLGFYAFQAFNMEHTCFTSRETNAIYAGDAHLRTRFAVPEMSDPLPCSSAVAVLLLRHLLLTEETKGAGEYTGDLLLLPGAPRKWFEHGKIVAVTDAPTHFGKGSFKVVSRADEGLIQAEVTVPRRDPPHAIRLRLPHPRGRRMTAVLLNGRAHKGFDAEQELIVIDRPRGTCRVEARYGEP